MSVMLRLALAALGAAGSLAAVACWADPAAVGRVLGLAADGPLGLASLRADIGGFFAVSGGFALWAAARNARGAVVPALALIVAALCGRILSLLLERATTPSGPTAVELAIGVVLAAALFSRPRTQ